MSFTEDVIMSVGGVAIILGSFVYQRAKAKREETRELRGLIRGIRIAQGMTTDENLLDRLEHEVHRRVGYFNLYSTSKLPGE